MSSPAPASPDNPPTAQDSADLLHTEVLLVDCQTTGATPEQGHLLELGWARVSGDRVLTPEQASARVLRLPEGADIPPRVSRITGIRAEDVREACAPEDVFRELREAAGALGPASVSERGALTVIHYARFETRFLDWLQATCAPASELALEVFCTHEIARRLLPDLPRRGLHALAGYFGGSPDELRRSAAHVAATSLVWHHLLRLLRERGVRSPADLRALLARPGTRPKKRAHAYPMARDRRLSLPDAPGVYHMLRQNGDLLYIGKAKSLARRVNTYFQKQSRIPDRTLEMLTQARDLRVEVTESALEAALLECDQIKALAPPYNVALKDDAGRALYFASPALDDIADTPSRARRLGPSRSPEGVQLLALVRRALGPGAAGRESSEAARAWLFRHTDEGPDAQVFAQGLERFREDYLLCAESAGAARALFRLGHDMWCERLRAAERDLAADDTDTDTGGRDDDGELDELPAITAAESGEEPVWDADRLARWLARMTRHAVHTLRRGAWLCQLSESSIAWHLPESGPGRSRGSRRDAEPAPARVRFLRLERGVIVDRGDLPAGRLPPAPGRPHLRERLACFDRATYDRLRVLTTELRRLIRESPRVCVRLGERRILDRASLARTLAWV